MSKSALMSLILVLVAAVGGDAQPTGAPRPDRPWFVGSSLFVLANATPDPPSFYQLNVGRWIDRRDVLSLEILTWRYSHPLGIPYGPSLGSDEESYPGSVRGSGAGLAYQRYLWRGLYSAAHATALRQDYHDPSGRSIGRGFQLFLAGRMGYHMEFARRRFFVEPSVAITHWPVNTGVPTAFETLDDRWPSYFIGEPGLHVGVRF